jgi:hypothetical protein
MVDLFLSAAPFSAVVPEATGVELFFVRLFPDLDYHESVILQKTSLKGLILIIKSTYQG